MKLICKQRVVWEGFYNGVILPIYDVVEEDYIEDHYLEDTYPKWLATDQSGQVFAYYDEPTLDNGIWGVEEGGDPFNLFVAEFELDKDFDVQGSLIEICCS